MDNDHSITAFAERRYEQISIDQIKVINSRDRDQTQFKLNVTSIGEIGLMKPIRVNDRFLKRSGLYELICGEGRLTAYRELGRTHITAEVVTCTRKEAYLESLVENIARSKPGTMDFAREVKQLRDEGWTLEKIGKLICRSPEYVRQYILLVERGEERLIHGVEQGIFPITFALQVATSETCQLQHLLMDAFDQGIVATNNFAQARRLIAAQTKRDRKRPKANAKYTVSELKQDIAAATRKKASFVKQAESKENRFLTLLSGINALWREPTTLALLREEGLNARPDLHGDFQYETCEP